MKTARLTLKNYRGFSDADPLRIDVGPGFTAIVGPNNSGKSVMKLFFYEFRALFNILCQPFGPNSGIGHLIVGDRITINYNGVSDPLEIFTDYNERPLTIELEILNPSSYNVPQSAACLNRIVGTCERGTPNTWQFAAFGSRRPDIGINLMGHTPDRMVTATAVVMSDDTILDFTDFHDTMQAFLNARYFGPFRNAINQGSGAYFDLNVGTAFVRLWNQWKTGGNRSWMRAIDLVTEDIRRLFGFNRLEINSSVELNTLIITIDGKPYRLNELGSGLAQFIIVLGNAATMRPSMLLIDEPETNLHPSRQIDFLLSLARYAQDGIIFSTHSIGLARSVADRIYSIQKFPDRTTVRPFEATPNYLEFVGELSFSAFKELGSDRILLVEGVHDVRAVQQLLRLFKKEHLVVILPLGGDQLAVGGREVELSEFTRLSNHIFAVVDSERETQCDPPSDRRSKFGKVCRKLGINVCITKRRAIENYFTDDAIKAALGPEFAALGPHEALDRAARPWSKGDNWRIARQMKATDLDGTDLGPFLAGL